MALLGVGLVVGFGLGVAFWSLFLFRRDAGRRPIES